MKQSRNEQMISDVCLNRRKASSFRTFWVDWFLENILASIWPNLRNRFVFPFWKKKKKRWMFVGFKNESKTNLSCKKKDMNYLPDNSLLFIESHLKKQNILLYQLHLPQSQFYLFELHSGTTQMIPKTKNGPRPHFGHPYSSGWSSSLHLWNFLKVCRYFQIQQFSPPYW